MDNFMGFGLSDVLLVLIILGPLLVVAVLGFRTIPQEERAVDPALASANRRILARLVDAIVLGFLGWIALVILWTLIAGPISDELADNQVFNTMVGVFRDDAP